MKHRIVNFITFSLLIASLLIGQPALASQSLQTDRNSTNRSDLAIRLVSGPERARACQTFTATFTVTNRGPNRATNVNIVIIVSDALEVMHTTRIPNNLPVGARAFVTATIKVVAFVPTEVRNSQITAIVSASTQTGLSIDPNSANNVVSYPIRLIGNRVENCP